METPYSFSDRLAELAEGRADAELTARLSDVIKAVKVSGGSGFVQLKLVVKRHPSNEDLVLFIPDVKFKAPTQGLGLEVFRAFGDGTVEPVDTRPRDDDEPGGIGSL